MEPIRVAGGPCTSRERIAITLLTVGGEPVDMPSGFNVILAIVVMIGLKKAWVRSRSR